MNKQNRNQAINMRQLCTGYFLYSIGIKVLSLPSALAQTAGNWAWLSALLGVVFEIVLVMLASLILKHCAPQKTGFRILCWIIIPLIIAEIVITSIEIYHLAYTNLFTDLGITIMIITLVALGLFFLTRQPRAVFRAGEVLRLFFILGLILAIVPTFYNLQVNWQDLIHGKPSQVLTGATTHILFFETATFVLVFGSETKKSNRDLFKINLTAILCGIGYLALMVLFVLLFGSLTRHQTMGLVDMTTASEFITHTGSLDWLIATSILATLILRFGLQLVAVVTCIKRGLKRA